MKRLSIILALLLFLSVIASCGDKQSADYKAVDTTTDSSSTTDAETEAPFGDDLPNDLDFKGEKVRVLIFENGNNPSDGWCNYIDMDESNGDILNDSAVQRNMEVETRLNVEIECIDGSGVVDRVAKSVTAGEDAYDIAIPFSTEILTKLITSNMLYDVSSLPHIDLSKPYYTKDSYETYEINGRHYLFSGAYTYPLYSTVSWLFNKDEWKNRGIDDAYQTVYDGKWTLDYVSAVIKDTYIDLDGDGRVSGSETFARRVVSAYEGNLTVLGDPSLFINAMLAENPTFIQNLQPLQIDGRHSRTGTENPVINITQWIRETPPATAALAALVILPVAYRFGRKEDE